MNDNIWMRLFRKERLLLTVYIKQQFMEKVISSTIKSILIGIIVCILLGYVFSDTRYYEDGVEVDEETGWSVTKEEFNYKIGLISGAIVTMVFMFVFYDDKNRAILSERAKKVSAKIPNAKDIKPISIDIKPIKGIFNPDGRMGRTEYIFKLILLKLFCYGIFSLFGNKIEGVTPRMIFIAILGLFYLFVLSVLMTKRLHDMNLSTWSIFIGSILIGIAFPLFELDTYLKIVSVIYIVFFVIILTFYPGSKSENKYGDKTK